MVAAKPGGRRARPSLAQGRLCLGDAGGPDPRQTRCRRLPGRGGPALRPATRWEGSARVNRGPLIAQADFPQGRPTGAEQFPLMGARGRQASAKPLLILLYIFLSPPLAAEGAYGPEQRRGEGGVEAPARLNSPLIYNHLF